MSLTTTGANLGIGESSFLKSGAQSAPANYRGPVAIMPARPANPPPTRLTQPFFLVLRTRQAANIGFLLSSIRVVHLPEVFPHYFGRQHVKMIVKPSTHSMLKSKPDS